MIRPLKTGLNFAVAITLSVSACGGVEEDYGPDEPEDTTPEPIDNRQAIPPVTTLTCPKATYLTYENFGKGFMSNYCTSCHGASVPDVGRGGAPADVNFDTSADVLIWRKGIMDRTVLGIATASPAADPGTGTGGDAAAPSVPAAIKMPPSDHVTPSDLVAFGEWMNCGAPVGSAQQ